MTNIELIDKLYKAAACDTLYVLGCFGAPLNEKNKQRYTNNRQYNQKTERKSKILASNDDTFGFDCVCLLKAILWGWNGDKNATYGGAKYQSNNIPDTTITNFIENYCTDVSEDFTNITEGEFLVMPEHCGIYVGKGLAIESTPIWDDGVQITEVWNIKETSRKGRKWVKHGKLKCIDYITTQKPRYISIKIPSYISEDEFSEITTVITSMGLEYKTYEEIGNEE